MMNKNSILLVDDEPMNLKPLADILKKQGYGLLIATNGERAIQIAQRAIPELILLDIRMPGLDGFEVCVKLKEIEATKDIPVIFLTALSQVEDKVKAFEVGGVDYITKPFYREEVLARVNTHLKINQLTKTLAQKNKELQEALDKVSTLSGLIPICAYCKKIRDDSGYWHQVEAYIQEHSEADFTHGMCPECIKKIYPEFYEEIMESEE